MLGFGILVLHFFGVRLHGNILVCSYFDFAFFNGSDGLVVCFLYFNFLYFPATAPFRSILVCDFWAEVRAI